MHKAVISFIRTLVFLSAVVFGRNICAQTDPSSELPQFLLPHFDTAWIKLKSGETTSSLMNYNTLTEKMTFYRDGEMLDLVKTAAVDAIIFREMLFVPVGNAFYEVVLNAPVTFFIQHKSELISEGRPAALGLTSQTVGVTSANMFVGEHNSYNMKLPESFRLKPLKIFWIRKEDKMLRFLTTSQFLKFFPDNKDDLKKYIKQNNIDINARKDLFDLAVFCNNLK